MADSMRVRHSAEFQFFPVASASVIEVGDACYYDAANDQVLSASALADAGTLAANQEAFHDLFVGVAQSRSLAGETKDVRICTKGVVEFDADSASFNPNDLVGLVEVGTGDALEPQKVGIVATTNLSIGRPYSVQPSTTKVLVNILSSYRGGVQTAE